MIDVMLVVADWIVSVTVQVSVAVVVLIAVMAVGKYRIAPQWLQGLWGLVFLRLAVPWTLTSPTSIYNLSSAFRSAPGPAPQSGHQHPRGLFSVRPAPLGGILRHPATDFAIALGAIWLAGIVVLGTLTIWNEAKFRRQLRLAKPCHHAGSGIRIWETPVVDTPAVVGVFRPRILVPAGLRDQLTPNQWQHVIAHEHGHILHGDVIVRWGVEVLSILYWFNPAVWLARHWIHETQEWAADAGVLSQLPIHQRVEYGRTLLAVMDYRARGRRLQASAPGIADRSKSAIQRRLKIMIRTDINGFQRWSWVAIAVGLGVIAMAMTAPIQPRTASPSSASGQPAPTNPKTAIDSPSQQTASYPVNAHGQTYGKMPRGALPWQGPDLIAVQGTGRETGYVYASQVFAGEYALRSATTPQEGLAVSSKYAAGYTIPVYLSNGTTVIGHFTVGNLPPTNATPLGSSPSRHIIRVAR